MDLSPDIWVLVFEEFAGDYPNLCNVSLVSHSWRTLSWPCLLKVVDLSSHNIAGRLTERESSILPVIYSHHHAKYRPQSLVPRQREFLHLITAQSALARHVQSLTWTLVWNESERTPLLDIDRETWNVFSRLINVTKLDLASINDVWDDETVRQNPTHLFPRVTDLRLLGWMHRDVVKAIVSAIDATKLRRLRLDYLEEQGAMPDGQPLSSEITEQFARNARRASLSDDEDIIGEALFARQEKGKAAIFPGPMWYAMRSLSSCSLNSLFHLQIIVPHFTENMDIRNYYTAFRESAKLLRKASSSLRSLVIIFGESTRHHYPIESGCGNDRIWYQSKQRPWSIKMAAAFLKEILIALSERSFHNLSQLTFEGFHLLENECAGPDLGGTLPYIQKSRFNNTNFTGTPHVDGRLLFEGFDCAIPEFDEEVLRNS